MRFTGTVPMQANKLNDTFLTAMTPSEVVAEANALRCALFPGESVAHRCDITRDERDGLIDWIIRTFPHQSSAANPALLHNGLTTRQVAALHYRLAQVPNYVQCFVDALPPLAPRSDVVALLPAHCGQRLSEMLGGLHFQFAVVWAGVFGD